MARHLFADEWITLLAAEIDQAAQESVTAAHRWTIHELWTKELLRERKTSLLERHREIPLASDNACSTENYRIMQVLVRAFY